MFLDEERLEVMGSGFWTVRFNVNQLFRILDDNFSNLNSCQHRHSVSRIALK